MIAVFFARSYSSVASASSRRASFRPASRVSATSRSAGSTARQRRGWFRTWLRSRLGSRDPDTLATAFDYVAGAPARTTAAGVKYSGAARYTPDTADDAKRAAQGKPKSRTGSDFYDYLGIPWTFPDTVTRRPEKDRARSVDSSGYVRLVYGYRSGFPLNSRDSAAGSGLRRTPDAIAHGRLGVPVIPLSDRRPAVIQQLQPGDLVFFSTRELPGGRIGHIGIYLGLDTADHPRFISSRKNAGGPTMGDKGGTSRLDGGGYYAQGLRAAPHASDFQLIEDTNSMATMCMWLFLGNAVVLAMEEGVRWPTVVLCAAALTVVRILPIMLAFLGSTFTWRERLMVGALGPRGTTSIVFGLLAFNALPDGRYADTALYARP